MAKKLKEKLDDIRKLDDLDLVKELEETHRRLFSLRIQKETHQIQNHREIPAARRQIARLKTIRKERQLAEEGR